jgi:hypothetical protein
MSMFRKGGGAMADDGLTDLMRQIRFSLNHRLSCNPERTTTQCVPNNLMQMM